MPGCREEATGADATAAIGSGPSWGGSAASDDSSDPDVAAALAAPGPALEEGTKAADEATAAEAAGNTARGVVTVWSGPATRQKTERPGMSLARRDHRVNPHHMRRIGATPSPEWIIVRKRTATADGRIAAALAGLRPPRPTGPKPVISRDRERSGAARPAIAAPDSDPLPRALLRSVTWARSPAQSGPGADTFPAPFATTRTGAGSRRNCCSLASFCLSPRHFPCRAPRRAPTRRPFDDEASRPIPSPHLSR